MMRPEAVCLSVASIWEALLLIQLGRIGAKASAEQTVRAWIDAYPIAIVPIDKEIAIASRTLPFAHSDPMDRFIAATAARKHLILATSDENLVALPWLRTIS